MLVGEVVVGAVDGVAGVDLRLGEPEHLFARQRLGTVRGDDHIAEYLLARRDDHPEPGQGRRGGRVRTFAARLPIDREGAQVRGGERDGSGSLGEGSGPRGGERLVGLKI